MSENSPLLSGTTASPPSSGDSSATKQWKCGRSELKPSSSKTATKRHMNKSSNLIMCYRFHIITVKTKITTGI
jgi:hypothetical protein